MIFFTIPSHKPIFQSLYTCTCTMYMYRGVPLPKSVRGRRITIFQGYPSVVVGLCSPGGKFWSITTVPIYIEDKNIAGLGQLLYSSYLYTLSEIMYGDWKCIPMTDVFSADANTYEQSMCSWHEPLYCMSSSSLTSTPLHVALLDS